MGTLFYGTGFLATTQRQQVQWRVMLGGGSHPAAARSMAWTAGGICMAAWLRQIWNTWWMSSKIVDSTSALELWNRNWHAIQAENNLKQRTSSSISSSSSLYRKTETVQADKVNKTSMMSTCAVKSERLVQYALNSRPEVSQVRTRDTWVMHFYCSLCAYNIFTDCIVQLKGRGSIFGCKTSHGFGVFVHGFVAHF
jgi:hypothetical protein